MSMLIKCRQAREWKKIITAHKGSVSDYIKDSQKLIIRKQVF